MILKSGARRNSLSHDYGCAKLETPKDIYQKSLMLRICRDGKFIVMRYTRERNIFITMVEYSLKRIKDAGGRNLYKTTRWWKTVPLWMFDKLRKSRHRLKSLEN